MLLLSLQVCVQEWRGNFGAVLWFGWLTVAALVLVFALAEAVPREAMHKDAASGTDGRMDCHVA